MDDLEEPIDLYPELTEVTMPSCCYICLHFSAHNSDYEGECLYYKYYISDSISYKCRSYK